MSKIFLLSDLHGNMTATKAMEQEMERIEPDEVIFLGDCVGKGPENDLTLDWVRSHCDIIIGGNWDFGVSSENRDKHSFYSQQLGEERLDWLRNLPTESELLISGVTFRLFHGRPVVPLLFGMDSDEVLAPYLQTEEKTYGGYIFGDSHKPFIRVLSEGYAINTGSVGNGIGIPRAHALLLEGEKDNLEMSPLHMSTISVPYDNETAAKIAEQCTELPKQQAYIREVLTGIYSR